MCSHVLRVPNRPTPKIFSKFLEASVSASKIGLYWYCAAKIVHQRIVGDVETMEKIGGAQRHEDAAEDILKRIGPLREISLPKKLSNVMKLMRIQVSNALARKQTLANKRDVLTYVAVVPELRCFGVPDEVDCKNGEWPLVIERKYVRRIPQKPWLDHCVQVGVYVMGLMALGFSPPYGILRYHADGLEESFRVELGKQLEDKIRTAVMQTRAILNREIEPKPTSNPRKCRVCEYRVVCKSRSDIESYDAPYIFDIETDTDGRYIWGISIYYCGNAELKQFFAEKTGQESQIIRGFLSYVNKNPTAPILSFSGSDYDYRILNARLTHYGLPSQDERRFIDVYSYLRQGGLRGRLADISSPFYMYRHSNLKGDASWRYYLKFLKSKTIKSRQKLKRTLLEYNADDVMALLSICINRPKLFEEALASTVLVPRSPHKVRYLKEIYSKTGRVIRRVRPDRRRDIEVRFRSSNIEELKQVVEALSSIGFKAKISRDKNANAVRLYGHRADSFLRWIEG